jgi:hypothetical protein
VTGTKKRTVPAKVKRKPPKPQAASAAQHKRFAEAAREIEADETGKEFERAFRKIVPPKLPGQKAKS